MKIYRHVLIVLVLSMVAANAGYAASGPAPKNGGRSTASGKAGGGQQPGGGKGTSSVNGTGIGTRH